MFSFSPPLIIIHCKTYDSTQRALLQTLRPNDHDIWYAETPFPLSRAQVSNPWLWRTAPRKLPRTLIYPAFNAATMTLAPQTPDPSAFTKKLDLLNYSESLFNPPWLRDITLREIQTCEILRLHPHPNVCQYRGVIVTQNLVTGLVFDRYDGTLADLVDSHTDSDFTTTTFPVDIPTCLAHVTAGLTHLHALGLVHCDIKLDNIFVDAVNQRYVIGDFDAVHAEGDELCLKCGTNGWVPEDEDTDDVALKQIDWYSVHMLAEYLEARKRGERCAGEVVSTGVVLERTRRELMEGVKKPRYLGGVIGAGVGVGGSEQVEEDVMDESW